MTWPRCPFCEGAGWVTVARQGDPAPGGVYAATVLRMCECRTVPAATVTVLPNLDQEAHPVPLTETGID